MADNCDSIRNELGMLEAQLLLIDKFLAEPEPGEPHPPHPVLNPEWKKKDAEVRSKRSALVVCENPILKTAITPTIQLQNLRSEQAQEDGIFSDGDEPYLVALGFRSQFRSTGTTRVFWSGDLHELGHLDSGDSIGIGPSMGDVMFPGVQIIGAADLIQGRFPEMFGAFVLCLESDGTPFSSVHDLIEQLRDALNTELVRLIEQSELVPDFSAPQDQISAKAAEEITKSVQTVADTLKPTLIDAIGLWLQSFSDPDDLIGYHAILFVGVDDALGSSLPTVARPSVSVGQFRPGPLDLLFEGDAARYRVTGVVTG